MAKTVKKSEPTNVRVHDLSMAERYPRNVSQQLFDSWQVCRRKNDPKELCKKLKMSRPIIDRALNYGHVKNEKLTQRISAFFNDRYEREKKQGQELINAVISNG